MVHDFVRRVDAVRADVRRFLLSPARWRASRVSIPITWHYIQFTAANRAQVPRQPGIYAFIVRHVNNHFPGHGFIMYVGITGAIGPRRTLHERYGEYLREQVRGKRPKVAYMLQKYRDDIHFAFAPVNLPSAKLAQLELDMNDALIPPVVVKDFTAEIRTIVKALE